jgi:hypothetical protein
MRIQNCSADAQCGTEQQVNEKQYNWILQSKWLIHTFYHTNEKNRYTKHKLKHYISRTLQFHMQIELLYIINHSKANCIRILIKGSNFSDSEKIKTLV